jgi:peptide/nickel transport system substrate-binding protein
MRTLLKLLLLSLAFLGTAGASAADLTIAVKTEIAMDPHYLWSGANTSYYMNFFGALTKNDDRSQIKPDLAQSWKMVSDTEWQFTLRDRVKFSDGTPVTAQDVADSFHRALTLSNAAGPYKGVISTVSDVKAEGEKTVVFTMKKPDPLLAFRVSMIQVIPSKVAKTATTDDFNAGRNIIGSGPYKFVSYRAGNSLVLERNPNYYGEPARWDKVTFRFVPNDAARVAALLSGDVDYIDSVEPSFIQRLRSDPKTAVYTLPSDRVIFLTMDTERDVTPFVTAIDGTPLAKNPLKDKRVREALTIAIDRTALASRVMEGAATPAGQLTTSNFSGYNATIKIPAVNVARAKQLLAEAGYDKGFALTLHCTNDRYVNDSNVCQAVGQMFSRVGIKTTVQTVPKAVLFPKLADAKGERFSMVMLGWASYGEADGLASVIHTNDPSKSLGVYNGLHYSNPTIDRVIEQALATANIPRRTELLAQAMKLTMDDFAIIPLYLQNVTVATRKSLYYRPWSLEYNYADGVVPLTALSNSAAKSAAK